MSIQSSTAKVASHLVLVLLSTVSLIFLAATSAHPASVETLTFGGNLPWFLENTINHDGIDAYQSGGITNSQSSWMETTVTGPGAIRFWWKVSSESCCDPLTFAIDGAAQANIRGAIDWESKAYQITSGTHILRWTYSTDGSVLSGSNAGWVDQITFEQGTNIDVTSPATTATPPAGMYSSSQNVTLSCTDNIGCTGTFYCLGSDCNPTLPYNTPIPVSSATDLRFYSTDAAGNNEAVKTASYTFDTTPPTTYVYPSAGTYSGTRSITLSCNDSGMGCANTYYCLGSGCTPATGYNTPISVTASTDLRYFSTDRGGNNEAVKTSSYTINPDTTPPTTTTNYSSGTYSNPYVHLSCNDGNGSGCAATYYCLGAGCTPTTRFTTGLSITASTDIRFYSQDSSGNKETIKTVRYTIDNTPPTTTVTLVGGIYTGAQNVTLSCSDGSGSGCSTSYYCLDKGCSPNTTYSGPISITSSTYLSYYSRDMASNQENVKTERYTVLTVPPVTINVPADRTTIQSAIDAANDGDTVVVSPGNYVENIDFKGKAITVRSNGGAAATIIDGNQLGPVASFSTGEASSSILDGFTLRNGNAGWHSPNYGDGGGIYISSASPTIRNNLIAGNSAAWGGGIYVGFGSPLIQNNKITQNYGSSYGGGIEIGGSASAQVIDNVITDNRSDNNSGGGISMWAAGTPTVKGNLISNNIGGGIHMVNGSSPLIAHNVIANNQSADGSAVYWLTPSGELGPYLLNNTMVDTSAAAGSVVYADGYDINALFVNNVVVAAAGRTGIYCGNFNDNNPPHFSHNIVYSKGGNAYGGYCANQNGINGNITADPLLDNPELGYYGLLAASPAIDAGDSAAPSLPSTDLTGVTRILDGNSDGTATVDMGAYEFDRTMPVATISGGPTGYTNSVGVTYLIGGDRVVSYRVSVDGGEFSNDLSLNVPLGVLLLPDGPHHITVLGKDASGREQLLPYATLASWNVDTTPPVTSSSPQAGIISPRSVTLSCSDGAGSGCSATYYCLGSGCMPSIPYSATIDISASTDIRYYSVDTLGNTESIKTASYVVDTTAPVTSASPPGGTIASRIVTLSCSDGTGGGCAATYYCIGSGCNPTSRYVGSIYFSASDDLRFYSVDAVGNSEQIKSFSYVVPSPPPPPTNIAVAAPTQMGQLTISWTNPSSSTFSHIHIYRSTVTYSLGVLVGDNITGSTYTDFGLSSQTTYYYTVRTVDPSGTESSNATPVTGTTLLYTPYVDTSPPSTTAFVAPNVGSSSHAVTLHCNDATGCAATYYCLGSGCTPQTLYSDPLTIDGENDVRYYSRDTSGNLEVVKTASIGPVDAGVTWQQTGGPYGGYTPALVIDPSNSQTLYVGTYRSGVLKSTTGGATWSPVNSGLTATEVYSLVIDPNNSQILYAGTHGGGVFKSTTGGATWSPINSGLTATDVYSLVIDPNNSQIVYAGAHGGGVFKSTTGGASWNSVNTGLTDTNVSALVIDRGNSQTLYAGTTGGVFKSSEGGSSWSAANTGLTNMYVRSLVIDPRNSQILYAGTGSGVFKTSTGGVSWSPVNPGVTSTAYSMVIDPNNSQILYAGTYGGGVFKSTTGGASWSSVNTGLADTNAFALVIDGGNSQTLYAGTYYGGVFMTSNGGASWSPLSAGLTATTANALAIDPTTSQTIYTATYGGVFKSTTYGASWSPVNTGLTDTAVNALAIDPTNSQTLYAGTLGWWVRSSGVVFKSTNGGASWSPASSGLTAPQVLALAIDPRNSQTIYAGTNGGVFKTTNGGATWSPVNTGLANNTFVESLAIDPNNSQTLYVGTGGGKIYKTTNGGGSWGVVNSGMTATDVYGMAIDPRNSQTIYVGTYGGGVYKSTTGGASWNPVNNGLTASDVNVLNIDPVNSQIVYAGSCFGGVFKSTNGGASWSPINAGLTNSDIYSMVIDRTNNQTIYLGTNGSGVFKTVTYTISGTITNNGTGLAGVTFSGASCTTTDSTGAYSCSVASGWNGTIMPALAGYTFTPASGSYLNVTGDQTGHDYTTGPQTRNLTVSIAGGGSINGMSTLGQGYACANASCPAISFAYGDHVEIFGTPDWKSLFSAWSGDCRGADPCTVAMTADRSVTATFAPNLQVRVPTASPTDFATIQDGYDHAVGGGSILARVNTFYEDLLLGRAVAVTLDGGKDASYLGAVGYTTVRGSLTIGQGTVVVGNLVVW